MAGLISSVDFGDLGSAFKGLSPRQMNIKFLLSEKVFDYIFAKVDDDTAKSFGVDTSKNKKNIENTIKNELLKRIKGFNSKKLSFLVENVTVKDQENSNFGFWRFRIRPDIPAYNNYVFNNQSLVFECDRKTGRLRVRKVYLQRVPNGPLPTEMLVEGPVIIVEDEDDLSDTTYMNKSDFDWLLKLEPRRKKLEIKLDEWESYLKLYLSYIRKKQAWIEYSNIVRTGPQTARINLSDSKYSNNATKRYYDEDEVMVIDHETPNNPNWKPDEDTEEPIRFGTILNSKPIKQNINQNKKKKSGDGWFEVEIQLADRYTYYNVQEPGIDTKRKPKADPLDKLPTKGLLVNSLFYDEFPITLQQKAIKRLKEGSASNPKIEDFIFDIEEARIPSRDEEIERKSLVETELNDSQLKALSTSLNSPDISLIQGPPGTGKTTVIAELCYQTALRGGKVLLASQSNLAVDNALSRLTTKKSEIMPIRIGKRTTEEGQDFVEENVVPKWFQSVKESVKQTVDKNSKLISDLEQSEQSVKQLDICFKSKPEYEKRKLDKKSELKWTVQDLTTKKSEKVDTEEETNLLLEKVSLLKNVKNKGIFPVQRDFEIFADLAPETVPVVEEKIKKHFSEFGIELKVDFDPIDIGEILGYFESFSSDYTLDTLKQLETLKALISKLDYLKNDEIKELETKQSNIITKLPEITDPSEMGEKTAELAEINQKIQDIKSKNDELRLGERWRDSILKLKPLFANLVSISKLIGLKSLQEQIDPLQESIQPKKELEPAIYLIGQYGKIFSEGSFEITDDINLEYIISDYDARIHSLKKRSKQLDFELASLESSRKELESQIDSIEIKIEELDNDVQNNTETLVNTGFFTNNSVIDRTEVDSIKSRIKLQKDQQKDYLDNSKRWINLQSEWIQRIEEASKEEYESLKDTYIDLANIVGATCTETGKHKFWGKDGRNFDLVIIDEVSKATPPELLMPMLLGKQIILVGDHQQLPPLFKINAKDDELPINEIDEKNVKKIIEKYERLVTTSYFKEMFEDADDLLKARLTIQYRMHPSIMHSINQFYPDGYKLECGIKDPDEKRKHNLVIKDRLGNDISSRSSHLIWVDTGEKITEGKVVPNFEERETGKYRSRFNTFEVETIEKLLLSFSKQLETHDQNGSLKNYDVALISFYAGQVRKLKQMEQRLKSSGAISNLKLKVGTVDRFQGMESPIVIVSLVSSPKDNKPTSFVKEFRRINVAFSRAQSLLVIVGSERAFSNVEVPIDHDGMKEKRKSYGEILNNAKSCVAGNYYAKGYDVDE